MKEITIDEFVPGFEFLYKTDLGSTFYWNRQIVVDIKGKFVCNLENITKRFNEDKSKFKRLE